jgi:hypothetical protein
VALADDERFDRLYAAPLGEWVATRDALARELRDEGQRDEAEAVKALRKPPAPVWAANQLARRRPRCVERLLAAAERLRAAQAGRREDFRAASAEERDALEAAVAEGRSLLAEAGADSEAMVARLERTLGGAAAVEETAAILRAGRLKEEVAAAGFEALLGAFGGADPAAGTKAVAAKPPRTTTADRAKSRRAAVDAAQKNVAAAREAAAEARRAVREAERRAAALRRDWERAQKEADEAVDAAAQAEADLDSARDALAEARET